MKTFLLKSGFTLIELLVVISLIALMAAGLGTALTTGGSSKALQNAQGTILSSVSGLRAQAAINNSNAALVMDADPASEGFLRRFFIVTHDDTNQNGYVDAAEEWNPAGAPIDLPKGIYLVPRATYQPAAVRFATGWPAAKTSTIMPNPPVSMTLKNQTGTFHMVRLFTSTGRTQDDTVGNKIVLGIGDKPSPEVVSFLNEYSLRGAKLSQYGVLTLINDSNDL